MCRLLGYLGAPIPLDALLYGFEQPFVRQSHAPRYQDLGRVNADGWGVGWWDPEVRPEPARYRTATPMWADNRFQDIAPLIRTGAALAAIRNASPLAPVEETGNAPFRSGPWLFAHNGFVGGFRDGLGTELRRSLSARRESEILGAADSEVIFAMVLDQIDAGVPPDEALAAVIATLEDRAEVRLNFLLGNGRTLWATRDGNSLFTSADEGGAFVASEPITADDRWHEVPERSLVTVAADGISVTTL